MGPGGTTFELGGTFSTCTSVCQLVMEGDQHCGLVQFGSEAFLNLNDPERDGEDYSSQTDQLLSLLQGSALGDSPDLGAGS